MIKERAALSAIRPAAIKVKEKRGAICEIAPQVVKKASSICKNEFNQSGMCGAKLRIAPQERKQAIHKTRKRGANYKIAPQHIQEVIPKTPMYGAIL